MKNVAILGSTGSIGKNALHVVRNLKDSFRVTGLSSHSQWEFLARQAEEFNPSHVALSDPQLAGKLKQHLSNKQIEVISGNNCLKEIVLKSEADIVVSAVVGAIGLSAAIETVQAGKILALANKEALVMAGNIVIPLA